MDLGLGRGLSQRSYDGIVQYIYASSKKFFEISCKKAIQEEIENNEKEERPILNLSVSGDGSWKKRDFSSLFGVTTLIAYHTGKVIDLIVKNNYCQTRAFILKIILMMWNMKRTKRTVI